VALKRPWLPGSPGSEFPQPTPFRESSSFASPRSGSRYRSDGCPISTCNGRARYEPLLAWRQGRVTCALGV
jgi:hypothetical protein